MNAIKLEVFDETYLEQSWVWLNDPEIKYLTNTGVFTKEQQYSWFLTLDSKEDYKLWGVRYNDRPIGVFGIKNIENRMGEYWGYIGEKEHWGKGLGSSIMDAIIDEARKAGLDSLYLKVIDENIRAIKLYKKMGFEFDSIKDGLNIFTKKI